MRDGDETQDGRGKRQPESGAQQRRAQATDGRRIFNKRIEGVRRLSPGELLCCLGMRRKLLIARWVATFNAGIERPLAAAASFKDISFSFSMRMVWRWSGGSHSIACASATSSAVSVCRFA